MLSRADLLVTPFSKVALKTLFGLRIRPCLGLLLHPAKCRIICKPENVSRVNRVKSILPDCPNKICPGSRHVGGHLGDAESCVNGSPPSSSDGLMVLNYSVELLAGICNLHMLA